MHLLKLLLKIAGWFLVASAALCFLISLFAFLRARTFLRSASRAQGAVIRLVERNGDSGTLYYPVYAFRDIHDVSHEIFSSSGSFPPAHSVGEMVTVLYRIDHPENAELDGFFEVWGLAALTGGIGTIQMFLGLAALIVPIIIKKFRREPPIAQAA